MSRNLALIMEQAADANMKELAWRQRLLIICVILLFVELVFWGLDLQ